MMTLLTSIAMIIFLLLAFVSLLAVVVYLNWKFYKERRLFKIKMNALHQIIAENSAKQNSQANAVKLSDALNQKLIEDRSTLSNAVFNLNYELFELLSKNNLLKK